MNETSYSHEEGAKMQALIQVMHNNVLDLVMKLKNKNERDYCDILNNTLCELQATVEENTCPF